MKTDAKHRGLKADHPDVKKRDQNIKEKIQERDELYAKIGRRPSALKHHEDAATELRKLEPKIDRGVNCFRNTFKGSSR